MTDGIAPFDPLEQAPPDCFALDHEDQIKRLTEDLRAARAEIERLQARWDDLTVTLPGSAVVVSDSDGRVVEVARVTAVEPRESNIVDFSELALATPGGESGFHPDRWCGGCEVWCGGCLRCRDCGAQWFPTRRAECSKCGSDAGPKNDGGADAPDVDSALSPPSQGATAVENCPSAPPSPLATCLRCGRGMNPGDEMCCPQVAP